MDPYQVLGISPGATTAEIEETYHRLLRSHHPDLHQDATAEELAAAGDRTRALNEAMAAIRAGARPTVRPVPRPAGQRPARPPSWFDWLNFVPVPGFWLAFTLILYWAAVVRLVPEPFDIAGIWLGVLGFGLLYLRAIRDRRAW